jgi:alpha-L-fucosidase 2
MIPPIPCPALMVNSGMSRQPLLLAFVVLLCMSAPAQEDGNPSAYDVIWQTPSQDSFGSMPLGNGDIGLNVWMERNGDLLFYISKVDAFDAGHLLPKLGRIRFTTVPAVSIDRFSQTLSLIDASVRIKAGDVELKVWVDANHPIVHLEGNATTSRKAIIRIESLRPFTRPGTQLPEKGTAGILFKDSGERLAWCYRNQSSAWAENFRSQNTPEMVARTKDPLLHRTSGCVLRADGFVRTDSVTVMSGTSSKAFDCQIRVLSSQSGSVEEWLTEASRPVETDWTAHCAYWASFWGRSYIHVMSSGPGEFNLDQCRYTQFAQGSKAYEGHKLIDATKNASQISQRYALERFCEAVASRGQVPPPYNGSLFTMDMPAGTKGFLSTIDHPVSADERDWAQLSFMWQNTRHPYWSMATRGDYDAIRPGMQFVRDGLDICRDRCRKIFGHEGAFIMEASWWNNVGVFNWEGVPAHLRYHHLATVELPSIMSEYYAHTHDRRFLNDVLLPCADEFLSFYEVHFPKRDSRGMMRMEGVGSVETYQGVTNPCTEIGGMKFLLDKLLSFDLDGPRRDHWANLRKALPGVPLRKILGLDLLAVGERYEPGRVLCESPELYSVYPFRQAWLGTPALLGLARQSFHVRTISLDGSNDDQATETGGWQAAPVQAAHLGLAREAARLMSINFNDRFISWHDNVEDTASFPDRPRPRFPAFWECKMDGTPDNDHGANSANALQSMLLQSDGDRILLLPAWPEEWDVSFKLHASANTTVECVFRDGRVQDLRVTPESRRHDIVDYSTLQQRVRTLVETSLADRNYLFGLPPMLDAEPKPGKTTGEWIQRYGHTLQGCKAGPWPNSVFCGNTAYIHVLDWPAEGVLLRAIPARVLSVRSVTGTVTVREDHNGLRLTGVPDSLDTIVGLDFDVPLDPFAGAIPSEGSLTRGLDVRISRIEGGMLAAEARFEKEMEVKRFELVIDNPGHRRGEGKGFSLQRRQENGEWKTVLEGHVFGTICSRTMPSVAAKEMRVIVNAAGIRRFDLY